jgi:hypothetical protein
MTVFQIINFVVWSVIAFNRGIDMLLMCGLMVLVGMMGGLIYANSVYYIVENEGISRGDKEVSMNILNLSNFLGIIIGALLSLLLDNTVF